MKLNEVENKEKSCLCVDGSHKVRKQFDARSSATAGTVLSAVLNRNVLFDLK